eukprot:338080-Pyramimonas_sp.AAC.1
MHQSKRRSDNTSATQSLRGGPSTVMPRADANQISPSRGGGDLRTCRRFRGLLGALHSDATREPKLDLAIPGWAAI